MRILSLWTYFGDNWINHENKIREEWEHRVKEDDTVLLPGDFSWAMSLKDTLKDFEYLCGLTGKKIMLKGNHDYWWNSLTKLNNYLEQNKFEKVQFLYNNAFEVEGKIIAGTRGWSISGENEEDLKIIDRELIRLELSLKARGSAVW